MGLERDIRRAKTQSLILLALAVVSSGLVLFYSYQLEMSKAELERVTAEYAVTLGEREIRREELDSADKEFLRFEASRVENNPIAAEDYYVLGIEAFAEKEYETAHEQFTEALRLRPTWPEGYLARGRNFTKRGLYSESLDDLSMGLKLSDDPQIYTARCFALLKLGKLDKALKDCNQAINGKPDNIWVALNYRGFVHYLLENDQKAIDDWKHAAEYRSRPSFKAKSLENLSLVYLRSGNWKQALDHADHIHILSDRNPWNCLFRGIAADQLGKEEIVENALNCWQELAAQSDKRALLVYLPSTLRHYLDSETSELNSAP